MQKNAADYVRFHSVYEGPWSAAEPVCAELNAARDPLRARGLVGQHTDGPFAGVGFGNLSLRAEQGFLITATATGGLPALGPEHLVNVVWVDPARNTVGYRAPGPGTRPSAESMTHHAFYAADPAIGAVVHVHALALWKRLLGVYPTTARTAEYGTPAINAEIARLFREEDLARRGLAVLAGHEEGLFTFGATLAEAVRRIAREADAAPAR